MKRRRVAVLVRTLSELAAGEGRRRWERSRSDADDPEAYEVRRAVALRETLERLGPLYIKVGQVLSTRPDLVSQTVIDALQDLHEDVGARPFSEYEPVLEANLGAHWRYRFASIDTEHPLGAASIAQVYGATTAAGEDVVIKIQRPGVAAATRMDMEILAQAVKIFAKRSPDVAEIFQPEAMLEVVFSAMRPEIDFTAEAENMNEFRELLEDFDNIAVPEVIDATREVLIMTRAPGLSIRQCNLDDFTQKEREEIGRDLSRMLFRNFMIDGVFHADPHPGNVFVAPGQGATIIDFGMVGRTDRRVALGYTRMMMAIALNDGEAAGRAVIEMSALTPRSDIPGFLGDMQRWVPKVSNTKLTNLDFGSNFNEFLVFCSKRAIAVTPGIALFGKASANIEGTLRRLAPELSPFDVFRDAMGEILRDQIKQQASNEELLRLANEAFFAARGIPEQIRYVAHAVTNGQFVLRTRDDALVAAQDREDARAKKMRRTILAVAGAALWHDHRRQRRLP